MIIKQSIPRKVSDIPEENIHIVNMDGMRSIKRPSRLYSNCFGVYVDGKGWLCVEENGKVYTVRRKKTMKLVVDAGLNQPGYSFVER